MKVTANGALHGKSAYASKPKRHYHTLLVRLLNSSNAQVITETKSMGDKPKETRKKGFGDETSLRG
ncbi:hypothetical protein HanIR_Chr12g0589871 [Helianthus annuus]|nr:hypothetical protein HanIR_Chr12g0589871 [Helianthus annuus]